MQNALKLSIISFALVFTSCTNDNNHNSVNNTESIDT